VMSLASRYGHTGGAGKRAKRAANRGKRAFRFSLR